MPSRELHLRMDLTFATSSILKATRGYKQLLPPKLFRFWFGSRYRETYLTYFEQSDING